MLYVYCGNDPLRVRKNAYTHVETLAQDGASVVRIDADSYSDGIVAHAVGSISLFGEKTVYLFDTPSLHEGFAQEVEDTLQALTDSETSFVIIEGALLAPEKKKYQKYGTLEESKADVKERFNTFALADALARRDKKALWIGLCTAQQEGIAPEEIIGTLWWQLKTLRLADSTQNAEEAGMKDFPYNKAKRALSAFADGDIKRLSRELLRVYHEGHAGTSDINLSLERWSLSL